jgi:hypothetical protein
MSRSRPTTPPIPDRCTLTTTSAPRAQPGRVHLGDRGGGQGPAVEGGEHLLDRPVELGGEHLPDPVPRRRGDVVLEVSQLLDHLRWEQVGPGGQDLAELDEGDPGLLQRLADRPGQALAALGGLQLGPPAAPQVGAEAWRTAIRLIWE